MLDVQAAWIGVAAPERGQDRPEREHRRYGESRSARCQHPAHSWAHRRKHLPLLSCREKLIAGDTLFAGSIGRTDLPGGSMQKIMQSLHGTVLALPDDTVVIPGHGPLTTIGEERENNPFLVKR